MLLPPDCSGHVGSLTTKDSKEDEEKESISTTYMHGPPLT